MVLNLKEMIMIANNMSEEDFLELEKNKDELKKKSEEAIMMLFGDDE